MKISAACLLMCLVVVVCAEAGAQKRHDPLYPREVDQLRESTQQPKKRIDLLISFARERMLAIDRLCGVKKTDASSTDATPNAIHPEFDSGKVADLLADLAAVIDELDDNLAMYGKHSEDLRRPLRHLVDAEAEFMRKLEALNESATPLQKRRLAAALEDALDSVKTSSESARAMLSDQLAKKGEDKEKPDRHEARGTAETHEADAERQ